MQNPIFNLTNNFGNQGNQASQFMNNNFNQGFNQTGMNNPMMNMNMNNGMNQTGMNNPMMNPGMMNMNNGMNQMGMSNPMMNPGMMNMGMGNMNMMQAAMNMNMMNNNNLENMNNMNMGNTTQSNNQFINVDFIMGADEENEKIMIQCSMDDKIQDLIDRFKTKTLEDVSTKKFIFNARALIPTKTVRDSEIFNGAKIFVVETKNVKGA